MKQVNEEAHPLTLTRRLEDLSICRTPANDDFPSPARAALASSPRISRTSMTLLSTPLGAELKEAI